MATRKLYHREPFYKHVARNEAAELQNNISGLTIWINDHPNVNADLLDLFNRKIELMMQLHDLCTELINFSPNNNQ